MSKILTLAAAIALAINVNAATEKQAAAPKKAELTATAEKAAPKPTCKGTTKKGAPCKSKVTGDTGYCKWHSQK